MIWRLRLFVEKLGRRWLVIAALALAALVAAGAVAAVVLRSGGDSATPTTAPAPDLGTNLFYLRATAPKLQVSGCTMTIRFTWKPDYHANQYIGAPALITTAGTGIEATHRKRFTARGVNLEVGPVSLAGGYQIWSAKVLSLDGDPPGNDTTIQAAPPRTAKCG